MHISVSKFTIIGSDNGLSPGRRQAIIWTNAGILVMCTLGTHFREILIEIHKSLFKKNAFEMSSAECRPFCHGLNRLNVSKMPCTYLSFATIWWPSVPSIYKTNKKYADGSSQLKTARNSRHLHLNNWEKPTLFPTAGCDLTSREDISIIYANIDIAVSCLSITEVCAFWYSVERYK